MLFGGVACTPDNGGETDNNYAELSVSPASISTTLEGTTETLAVTSNADWVVSCDQADVVITPALGNGDGTVSIEVPAATADRTFVIKFKASKMVTVAGVSVPSTKEFDVQVSQNANGVDMNDYVYYEDCGDDVEKNSDGYWPYVDQFEGWNPQGEGQSGVTYGGNNASVRASGAAYQPTAEAVGVSGQPYVFLNKVPSSAHFLINDIVIKGGAQYVFTFNVQCQNSYSGAPGFAEVTNDLVHLELSYDGSQWAKVNFAVAPNGGNGWYATTTEFKSAANATKLYARFTYEAPASNGGGRFDDFKLVEGGNGGELDFTVTPTPDPTPEPTPADAYLYETFANSQGAFTTNDVTLGDGLTYVWKHDASYACMKASAYSGSAKASESWLISPEFSLAGATSPVLSFDHAINHSKGTAAQALTLWVKENTATEWTQVTIPSYPASDSWTFYPAGSADLSAYVNKTIQIAFKYTSTAEIAATWEVKNVKVAEGSATTDPGTGEGGGNDDTGAEASGVFTSDAAFVCSADDSTNKVYTLGESKINGEACSGFKLGTSNNAGFFTSAAVGVSGTKTLGFYAMAWKGKTATLYIKVEGTDEVKSVVLKANDGATGNPPFTITVTDADYYSVELTGLTESSKVMFSTDTTFSTAASTGPRAVVAGVTLK